MNPTKTKEFMCAESDNVLIASIYPDDTFGIVVENDMINACDFIFNKETMADILLFVEEYTSRQK